MSTHTHVHFFYEVRSFHLELDVVRGYRPKSRIKNVKVTTRRDQQIESRHEVRARKVPPTRREKKQAASPKITPVVMEEGCKRGIDEGMVTMSYALAVGSRRASPLD